VVNLTGCRAWPEYVEAHVPVGPVDVRVRLEDRWQPRRARLAVADRDAAPLEIRDGWACVTLWDERPATARPAADDAIAAGGGSPDAAAHELLILE
jgi:hypothetical protein